jgi:hypothetical protein
MLPRDEKFIPFVIHNRWPDPAVKDLPLTPEVINPKGVKKAWTSTTLG